MAEILSKTAIDMLLLVPFQPFTGSVLDKQFRSTIGAHGYLPLYRAFLQFSEYVGRDLLLDEHDWPLFSRAGMTRDSHRSLTAVTLATHLEQAGLSWRVIDPGEQELAYWRQLLRETRHAPPACVGICSTFCTSGIWIRKLCRLVRSELPSAKIVLGGYYYTTNTAEFLGMDADVFCVGQGELRIQRIVRCLLDGGNLADIPGLYFRASDGSLISTGAAPVEPLTSLPPVDWRLAERIEPPIALAADLMDFGVETQRGCQFHCEFCTYRTLAQLDYMELERSVDAIRSTAIAKRGIIRLADATATFPTDRWRELLRALIARGGAPHPMWVYARVNDLDDGTVAMMAEANIRSVFIGQESGDQRILNAMRKGTNIKHVRPAVEALGRHGISAFFSFIHGFPGETAESIANTRGLICNLNNGFAPEKSPVLWYFITPLQVEDFSALGEKMGGATHYFDYRGRAASAATMSDEWLDTFIASSRVAEAPADVHVLALLAMKQQNPVVAEAQLMTNPDRVRIQRFVKAVQSGIAFFLEREGGSRTKDDAAMQAAKQRVRAFYDSDPRPLARLRALVTSRSLGALARQLGREWAMEGDGREAGMLTRALLAGLEFKDSGSSRRAYQTFNGLMHEASPATSPNVVGLASSLANSARETARSRKNRAREVLGVRQE